MSDHDLKDSSLDAEGKPIPHHDDPNRVPEKEGQEAERELFLESLHERVKRLESLVASLAGHAAP